MIDIVYVRVVSDRWFSAYVVVLYVPANIKACRRTMNDLQEILTKLFYRRLVSICDLLVYHYLMKV